MGGVTEWVLVPREPTHEMLDAGVRGRNGGGLYGAYIEMLAAAPTPPPAADGFTAADMMDARKEERERMTDAQVSGGGGAVEAKARAMFEAQADKLAAPWDRQWGPTRSYWRGKSIAALSAQPRPKVEAVELTVCCGRHECGGECGNEWRGMEQVHFSPDQRPASAPVGECPDCTNGRQCDSCSRGERAVLESSAPVGVEGLAAQLRRELSEDGGWDYTEYEKGRIAEKERCIRLLAALAQQQASQPASAPVEAEPGAVRSLVAAANAALALHPGDDLLWSLESAVSPFNVTKPAECAAGCPPQQVCDYCQIASLARQPAATLPDEDDSDLTVAYMAGRHDGRKESRQPAGVDEAKAYPLWQAIHAAAVKAGHPCNVGLAQVVDALDALAQPQGASHE